MFFFFNFDLVFVQKVEETTAFLQHMVRVVKRVQNPVSAQSECELSIAAPLYTSGERRGIAARRLELVLALDKNIFQSEAAARMAQAAYEVSQNYDCSWLMPAKI